MSSSPTPKASLAALPTEILNSILNELWIGDKAALRIMNKRFYTLIPPPTFDEIFRIESCVRGPFLACGYCLRLRPKEKFAAGMIEYHEIKRFPGDAYDWRWGPIMKRKWRLIGSNAGTKARCRFCVDCGPRPMKGAGDGMQRYRGDTWDEDGVPFTRCLRCGRCAQAWKKDRSMCAECHIQLDAQFSRPAVSKNIG